jgi:hypothetical protein
VPERIVSLLMYAELTAEQMQVVAKAMKKNIVLGVSLV